VTSDACTGFSNDAEELFVSLAVYLAIDNFENEDENHEGHNIRSGGGGCFIQSFK